MILRPPFPTLRRAASTIPYIFQPNRLRSSSRITLAPLQSRVHTNMTISDSLAEEQARVPIRASRIVNDVKNDSPLRPQSLAIPEWDDDPEIRVGYRPFILDDEEDWVGELELDGVMEMAERNMRETGERLRVLVLYGSLRHRSFSRLVAYEAARILFRLGCDVRVFDPLGLPMKDDVQLGHVKVQEIRALSLWSDGHLWVSPEQHGNLTAVFKNQIDWIPLTVGSVRPTQGRTLAIAQVSGGSQSFNSVNSLRILGRWMRMFTIPNQSSIPKAYTQFPNEGHPGDQRLLPSGNRERLVDCMEEFVRYTILMKPHSGLFADRFSERTEKRRKEELKSEQLRKD